MKTSEIRARFLAFFEEREHRVVASAPLVPANDPSLMFTNSGMVQFKNVFLGSEKPGYVRAVDVQRCLRAGGKHNDLDQVGYTARHHTFFEMLGNWSFGDYFKEQASRWAWELLTVEFGLAPEKLLATIYHTDDEAHRIWTEVIGLPADRVIRIGDSGAEFESDNFWQMADTGPCGPCTEIFYDHGNHVAGGPPGSANEDGDRFIEIWNLVFMQFDRGPDGTLSPLPKPCVDTGMGLERLAAILQGVHSNYEIDLFEQLIEAAQQLTDCEDSGNKSLRVIADHIRAAAFLIVDGVLPGNEGRGYVLRRIIRRALRHGWMLGVRGDFFWKMVEPLVAEMGEAYPELAAAQAKVERALQVEEQRFGETLDKGMGLFKDVASAAVGGEPIPGEQVFRLYDTYGFPVDLTADMARERGLQVDMAGFDKAMEAQRARARASSRFASSDQMPAELAAAIAATEFLGYETLSAKTCSVLGLVCDGERLQQLEPGQSGMVILDRTPFYAESGGQVGDTGYLAGGQGRFAVEDTRKLGGVFFGHVGTWQGDAPLAVGQKLEAVVDGERRQDVVLNHSATHLLHAALRKTLGEAVVQKGSLVAADRLRFDFAHGSPVTREQLAEVETLVNDEIRRNTDAEVHQMGYDDAIAFGALALFGEKYGDEVRVLRMGDFSTELCGGTHVSRTGDIGLFRLVAETGVAAGVRRIEAVTGRTALARVDARERELAAAAALLSVSETEVLDKLQQMIEKQKQLEKELQAVRSDTAGAQLDELAAGAREHNGIRIVAARVVGVDPRGLRDGIDRLKSKLGDCVVVLASGDGKKIAFACGVQGAAAETIKAGDVVRELAGRIGGKGGGRPDFAQGGGDDSPQVDMVLAELPEWLASRTVSTGSFG